MGFAFDFAGVVDCDCDCAVDGGVVSFCVGSFDVFESAVLAF